MFYVPESEVWEALQVDLYNGEPVDEAYIATLIYAAQERLNNFMSVKLADIEGELPIQLKMAIFIDVAAFYFNRINPELPNSYWDMITPFRAWGFGAAVETDG